MKVTFKNNEAVVRKENFYCKAGAYEHKVRTGWVLEVAGKVVLGTRLQANGPFGAYRHDYPEFVTRKALLADVSFHNDRFARRSQKSD